MITASLAIQLAFMAGVIATVTWLLNLAFCAVSLRIERLRVRREVRKIWRRADAQLSTSIKAGNRWA